MNKLAFAPIERTDSYVDLEFVPNESDEWSVGIGGSGVLRVHFDRSIELLEFFAGEAAPAFKMTEKDFKETLNFICENY